MSLLLLAALLVPPAQAAKASKEEVELVELFLKTPTAELPPSKIDAFVAIDPESLPRRLRPRFRGKVLELHTMRQLADGKKKGTVRTPEDECDIPKDAKSKEAFVLESAGYDEILEHEIACVSQRTKCTERDMMCEFTLQILVERTRKGTKRRYFLHPRDPLMAVVAGCRSSAGGQTNFFGIGAPVCSR